MAVYERVYGRVSNSEKGIPMSNRQLTNKKQATDLKWSVADLPPPGESLPVSWGRGSLKFKPDEADTAAMVVGRDSFRRAADRRLAIEINDIARRLRTVSSALSVEQRRDMLQSLGIDEATILSLARTQAQGELAQQMSLVTRSFEGKSSLPDNLRPTGNVAYREVTELYRLVEAIKDKVLDDTASGSRLVFAEGVTVKDLTSFTTAVTQLYGTYMKCKEKSELYDDINKITEALKQALKELPQASVDKFMRVLESFD